ncbi:MAG: ATPase, partial [Candidatus Methanomethylicota archaeon]
MSSWGIYLTSIISFWGKGGVGKTTCAASTAVKLASNGLKTLLVSSDPMPSLSDILELSSSNTLQDLPLHVLELSEDKVIEMWKREYGDEVYQVISAFLPVDKSIIDYVAGAPGIADEFCLAYVMKLQREGAYDYIVWDTAPAGGTLKLL